MCDTTGEAEVQSTSDLRRIFREVVDEIKVELRKRFDSQNTALFDASHQAAPNSPNFLDNLDLVCRCLHVNVGPKEHDFKNHMRRAPGDSDTIIYSKGSGRRYFPNCV